MKNKNIKLNVEIDLANKFPDRNTPISYDDQGNVLSVFGDDEWDLSFIKTGYSNSNYLKFQGSNIYEFLNSETIYHLKLIMFYEMFYLKRRDDKISYRTIIAYLNKYKRIAIEFRGDGSSFLNLKKNGIAKQRYLSSLSLNKNCTIEQYFVICSKINNIGLFYEINNFGFDKNFFDRLHKISTLANQSTSQTCLIPSRIYSEFITLALDIFYKFEKNAENLKKVFLNGNLFSLKFNRGRVKAYFHDFAKQNGLEEFVNDFNITTYPSFLTRIKQIQNIGFLSIACFSGMRKSEILTLSQECFSIINPKKNNDDINISNIDEIYCLNGYTSKTTKDGLKKTIWITSKAIEPIIKSLKDIIVLCKAYNDNKGYFQNLEITDYPLFPHLLFNKKGEIVGSHALFKYPTTLLNGLDDSIEYLLKNVELTDQDIKELKDFNPLINWELDYGLKIGEKWKFRPHQFRRSLVVYGVRSGMIRLNVLKKQLQHLTLDMTSYYGNSSGTAKDLFEQKIIEDFKNEKTIYQCSLYYKYIIDNDEPLYGGEGTRLRVFKQQKKLPEYLSDKSKTLQYFNEGRLSYKRTPLGGCSRRESCNKLGFSYITVCIDCKDSIFDSSSTEALIKTKKAYQSRLEKYQPESITYKQLEIEIRSIDRILNKINVLEINNV